MLRPSIAVLTIALLGACSSSDDAGPGESGIVNPDGKPGGGACGAGGECQSGVCEANVCTVPAGCVGDQCSPVPAPTFTDKTKNGTETDVDCGGPADGPRCAVGQSCVEHSDCASNGCAFDKKCAIAASCTALEGGHTCGPNDDLTKQNDCCDRAKVGSYTVDKYLVTAGRMRAFVTRLDGKLRDWAEKLPAGKWDQDWTAELPNSIDGTPGDGENVHTQLGPYYGKRSCDGGDGTETPFNGHTYWTPDAYGDKSPIPKNVLDTKALNCVPWHLLAALCAFDGGHLLKEVELRAAYTNNKTTAYPWGAIGDYGTGKQTPYAVQAFSYDTPGLPGGVSEANNSAFAIAPPGRRPMGYNATGHADLVGNLLEWTSDGPKRFVWKGSFENHAAEADKKTPAANDPYSATNWTSNKPWYWPDVGVKDGNPNGYYAIGGRCAY